MQKSMLYVFIATLIISACGLPPAITVDEASVGTIVAATFAALTVVPTGTHTPIPTAIPQAVLGTIALDFSALLCDAQWMNGGQHLGSCPSPNVPSSGGYATVIDPLLVGLPASSAPVLLAIPAWNGYSSLFLRYPSFTVLAGDRFRTILTCRDSTPCDVNFALEYYDSKGKFLPIAGWDYKTGDAPIVVDYDLSAFAGQTVDFVLTLRLYHSLDTPDRDNGLWLAPHIYRATP